MAAIIWLVVSAMSQKEGYGVVVLFLVGLQLIITSFRPAKKQNSSPKPDKQEALLDKQEALFKFWVLRREFFFLFILSGVMIVLDIVIWNISRGTVSTISIIFTVVIFVYADIIGIRFMIFMEGHNLQVQDLKQNREELKKRYKQELIEKGYWYFFKMKHGYTAAIVYWGIIFVLTVWMIFVAIYEYNIDKQKIKETYSTIPKTIIINATVSVSPFQRDCLPIQK